MYLTDDQQLYVNETADLICKTTIHPVHKSKFDRGKLNGFIMSAVFDHYPVVAGYQVQSRSIPRTDWYRLGYCAATIAFKSAEQKRREKPMTEQQAREIISTLTTEEKQRLLAFIKQLLSARD